MLLELRVKDFGIIEDIDWKLDEGFNVITGETGAGKSLVIDAVELLLTGTFSEEVIRHGASEAWVEGVISLLNDPRFVNIKSYLSEKGLLDGESTLAIACEVRRQKPGIIRINGHTVTKTILRQTGQLLIDIHGQSQHLSLLNQRYHLDFLDAYAHSLDIRNDFTSKAARLNEIDLEIKSLKDKEKETIRQEEFLKYQIDELKRAKLREGEDEELEQERHRISFSEKLKEYSNQTYQALKQGDSYHQTGSALIKLNEAIQAMRKLKGLDPALNAQLDYLEKTVIGVEEAARDIQSYGEKLEYDPGRLEEIESRLETINNLKRKYGRTISEVLAYLEKAENDLGGIGLSSQRRAQLEQERTLLKNQMGQIAGELSQTRIEAAKRLESEVRKELQDLEMSQMCFEVAIIQEPSPEGIRLPDGNTCAYNNEGIDNIEFMVSTNPGEPLKPLVKIASTGEISRFTLALKGALSEADNIPVLIFDEIDIGVGGRSGDILGRKLWSLAEHHQVICVTHLPQIAAYADAHFCVHKEITDSRTSSTLENLTKADRLKELAAMLAGPGYSQIALKSATELIQKAENWKQSRQKTPDKPRQLKF